MVKVSLQLQGDDIAALVPGLPPGLGGDKCGSVALEVGLVLQGDEPEPPGLLKFQDLYKVLHQCLQLSQQQRSRPKVKVYK